MPPTHLIIVCCHGIWLAPSPPKDLPLSTAALEAEHNWLIAPFQRGETPTFTRHIKEGLKILKGDEDAVLVFSGGPTRPETRMSEARSYYDLAAATGAWDIVPQYQELGQGLMSRAFVEEKALDSYQNVLFSLLRFWEVAGCWPRKISIVSHAFKKARFVELHLRALRWEGEVGVLGVDPEYMAADGDRERAAEVREGERIRGYDVWASDMYGMGDVLIRKRKARNPWGIEQDVWEKGMGEQVQALIQWHGQSMFDASLPWN